MVRIANRRLNVLEELRLAAESQRRQRRMMEAHVRRHRHLVRIRNRYNCMFWYIAEWHRSEVARLEDNVEYETFDVTVNYEFD